MSHLNSSLCTIPVLTLSHQLEQESVHVLLQFLLASSHSYLFHFSLRNWPELTNVRSNVTFPLSACFTEVLYYFSFMMKKIMVGLLYCMFSNAVFVVALEAVCITDTAAATISHAGFGCGVRSYLTWMRGWHANLSANSSLASSSHQQHKFS